jgi:beta-N-acetylhexosaminidase
MVTRSSVEALPDVYAALSLEEQVAQLFMLGYEGLDPDLNSNPEPTTASSPERGNESITARFLARGLGGLIFFRDNFEPKLGEAHRADGSDCLDAKSIRELLASIRFTIPPHLPPPLLGIDQEGGQVERLPHTIFPTAVTPQAIALSTQPEFLLRSMVGEMAARLATLGFNLNFAPTLDVNLNPLNPIIGVRAFGDNPKTVGDLGLLAIETYKEAGVLPVGKHFPGHGNGTVDSHHDLPTLEFSETELAPFCQAIEAGLPVMLIAHGFYPALQTTEEERALPSSASPAIIQGLLRQRCGFQGVLISDDMCMGAITQHRSAPEAAIASLKAGVDILLYRRSGLSEWEVYESVLDAFRSGQLPMARLHESLQRIAILKASLAEKPQPIFEPLDWEPVTCQRIADSWAHAALTTFFPEEEEALQNENASTLTLLYEDQKSSRVSKSLETLTMDTHLLLVHPDRRHLGNYAWDVATSKNLEILFQEASLSIVKSLSYRHDDVNKMLATLKDAEDAFEKTSTIQLIVFVAFNAGRFTGQAALAKELRQRYPKADFLLVSIGSPDDGRVIKHPTAHWALCSYRPASMRALVAKLVSLAQGGYSNQNS